MVKLFKEKIMAVQAKRFEFLNQETHIGVSDFITAVDSEIRNIELPDFKEATEAISDFISPLADALSEGKDALSDAIDNALGGIGATKDELKDFFRQTKDLMGLMADIGNMPNKLLDNLLGNLFPNGGMAKNLAKNLFKVCKSAGSGFGNMRPFDVGMDCNGKGLNTNDNNCKANGVANLLNTLTDGLYGQGFSNINSLVNAAAMIATASYSANMCGGFAAASSMLGGNKNAINRVGAMMMGSLGATRGLKGMIDVANNTDSYLVGKIVPNSIKNLFGDPNIDNNKYNEAYIHGLFGVDGRDNDSIYDSMFDTAGLLNTTWDTNSGIPTLSNIVDSSINDVRTNSTTASIMGNTISGSRLSTTDLNSVAFKPNESLSTAYIGYSI